MKNDIQQKVDEEVLNDLPYDMPREIAIEMSIKLYTHISARLVNEINAL
jgi:hypothetical protein